VSGADTGAVAVFARKAASGALTFLEAEKNGQNGVSGLTVGEDVVVSPDGANVYVLGFTPGAVLTFARNSSTGALTFVEKDEEGVNGVDGIGFATELAISPDGANVYVTGEADDSVAVFARDGTTGALTFVEAERDGVGGVDGIDGASAVAVSDDGAHVYAAGSNDDGLAVFARDAATGSLTFLQAFHEGVGGVDGINGPADVAVTPDGTHVLVAASAESEIGVFARNPATGLLVWVESVGGSALGGINSLRFAPGGQHLYTTARSANSVSLFAAETAPPTTTSTSTSSTSSTTAGGASTTLVPGTTSTSTTATGGSTTLVPTTTSTSTVPGGSSSTLVSATTLGPSTTSAVPSTTTTTLPAGCAGVAPGPTFQSIECRLAVLLTTTGTTEALGRLRSKVDRSVGSAADRVAAAHGICSFGKAKPTRRRLGKAGHQLARYVRRLRGRAARKAVPLQIREPLAVEAAAIAADLTTLRRSVRCPIDA
jgi:DNA-binding beta-propeller fold protein YncE